MKVVISILIAFCSLSAFSQNSTQTVFCIAPSCQQAVQLPISVDTLYARLTTADGYKSITWKQLSGPNTAIMGTPVVNMTNSTVGASIQPIAGLTVGSYTFQCTGLSTGGTTGTAQVSLTVSPAVVVVPPLKTVIFTMLMADGKTLTVFSDKSYTLQ